MRYRSVLCVALASLALGACVTQSAQEEGFSSASAYAPMIRHPLLGEYEPQTDNVSTRCFTPELEVLIAQVAATFGETPVVTSGFRKPRTKRQREGRGSYHTRCMAADIQVPGVAPSRVFSAVKQMDGRGGVGLYCHTRSVHVDVGPEREWSRPCRS